MKNEPEDFLRDGITQKIYKTHVRTEVEHIFDRI